MENILLKKSKKYSPKKNVRAKNTHFDGKNGYWELNDTHMPLFMSNLAKELSTKKEDIETGEDQKGE